MAEEETNEQSQEGADTKSSGKSGLASPEGVLMLAIAGIIDLMSIIPALNFAAWVIGILVIGGWYVLFHTRQAAASAAKKIWTRILVVLGCEVIPVVSIIPTWTWFVYKTLKDG